MKKRSEVGVHHFVINAFAIRAYRELRRITFRHPHLAAQSHHRSTGATGLGNAITRNIVRETIRIAIAAIIQLRLLFGAFQHRSAGT